MELFGRSFQVAVGQGIPGAGLPVGWEDIGCRFKITKTDRKTVNKATLTLFNLNATSRGRFELDRAFIAIRAGYGDGIPPLLFVGDVTDVVHRRDGSDILTEVRAHDGRRAYQLAQVNKSYEPGTPNLLLLQEAVTAMGLPLGHIANIPTRQYMGGFVASGPARSILDDVCDSVEATWSIQDGALQILAKDSGTNDEAVVVRADTGLVGSVSRTKGPGKRAKRKSGAKWRMLMTPSLAPGRFALVDSEFVSGFYRVRKVTHSGASRDQDWFTEVEATEVQAAPIIESVLSLLPGSQIATDWWNELLEPST